jgi:hypothetical protein
MAFDLWYEPRRDHHGGGGWFVFVDRDQPLRARGLWLARH